MQERQSPRDEPTLSRSDEKVVSPSSMTNEPEIVQGKLNSAIENPDSGASKLLVQSNLGQNRDVEKPMMPILDHTSMSESLATGSSKASLLPEKLPIDGMVNRPVFEEKLIPENRNDSHLSQLPITPKKESVIPSAEGCSSTPNVKKSPESEVQLSEFSKVSIITKADPDDLEHGHDSDTRRNDSTEPRKSVVLFHSPVPTSSSDQDNMSYSAMSEKTVYKLQPRRNPDSGVNVQIEQNNSSRGHEKALDDGYNWRKYGQKLVKGNSFVKSYYKCTTTDCRAKKQVERCNDGRLTDIKYIGRHEHPKPHSSQVPTVVQPLQLQVFQADVPTQPTIMKEEPGVAKNAENAKIDHPIEPVQIPKEPAGMENSNSVVSPLPELRKHRDHVDNSSPNPKRLKSETTSVEDNQVKQSFCESRQVVQMMSAVDIVHDGYRWRKYGQKLVKGNPNPRSYYRCSTAGCTVKKHVERASHDPKLVVTTYEGNHDHDMPNPRTITQTVAEAEGGGGNNVLATTNGEIKSEPGEQNKAGRDMVLPLRMKLQNTGAN